MNASIENRWRVVNSGRASIVNSVNSVVGWSEVWPDLTRNQARGKCWVRLVRDYRVPRAQAGFNWPWSGGGER